jgi:hypothetical protein
VHGGYPFYGKPVMIYQGGNIGLIIAQPGYFTGVVWGIHNFLIDVPSCPCYDAMDLSFSFFLLRSTLS